VEVASGHDYPSNRGYPAKKQRDVSKNRSHNPKTADTRGQSFFKKIDNSGDAIFPDGLII
jgi:hypothetical protein